MTYNLVIDADSILYTSCYNAQLADKKSIDVSYTEEVRKASFNIEKAYLYFCAKVARIEAMVYSRHREEHIKGNWRGKDIIDGLNINIEIIFSPKHTFRNDLSDIYKANRKPSAIFGISDLKKLVKERYGATEVPNLEADDIVITRAYEQDNVYIACIDKDITTHSPVDCINYNEWEWSDYVDAETIENNYYYQALLGDPTDNIKGAKGIGERGATALCDNLMEPMTYDIFISKFTDEEEAILNMRLVRLDQYKKGELELWVNQ
ncbi:MAG: hypothetical protein GQ570_08455 [Helicobacteraceae bacterium]|nr:hypothetical protein [Helicobacteraceae bacterium]